MFNGKALGLMLVACIFGVGAAIFANKWLQDQLVTEIVDVEATTTPVIVAAKPINFGETIENIHIKSVEWPKESVPQDAITLPENALGRLANQKILPGEPLIVGRVVDKLGGSKLSALISKDKRAVTVRVNDVAGVAGFLLPGSRVDVLGTRMVNRRAITKQILQNLKVLAIDQRASQDKDDPVVVRAVTLEADLEESLALVKATQEGTVQLTLRNPEDLAIRAEAKPVEKVRKVRPRKPTVEIIRGTSVGNSTLQN